MLVAAVIVFFLGLGQPALAQYRAPLSETTSQTLALTLDEAIQIALINNYAIRNLRLDINTANAQVREAWGRVMPQIDASSSYTRNVKSANPFSGSAAGGLFGSLGYIDWLAYNERSRTDDDVMSNPMAFIDFLDKQQAGLDDAGIVMDAGANPFAVPNQFQGGLTLSQTLFSGTAFAAIKGAEQLKEINQRGLDRQEQLLIHQVRQSFYQALLAEEQVRVLAQSVSRTDETVQEVTHQVSQGVAPKFQRLSAEVELANLETQLVQVQNQALLTLDNLKLTLGIPIDQPIRLRGALEAEEQGRFLTISTEDAVETALHQRPDVDQARLAISLNRINRDMTKAEYMPTLSAFANVTYIGNVPSNRFFTISDPDDPFKFSRGQNGYFSSSYWNPAISVGFRLSWTLFNGFQTSARMQQRQIAVEKSQIDFELQLEAVRQDVQRALRDLEAARIRIFNQEKNIERAELSYTYATARLREGVASQLEERNASSQLDQSRLNYSQAVHDLLVAQSALDTAMGIPVVSLNSPLLTDGRRTTDDE